MAGKTEYKNKWQSENCERISLVVKKGKKQIIKDFAAENGYTLNGFVNSAIDEKMQRETENST
ncbi:antitoxin [Ruminococcus sp.]|uniref:antitoxin n=1 Tax=Ruminococcus sp. TaxID=41978 RepID=UPI00386DCB17